MYMEHKYTGVADGMKVKSIIDLMLVKRDMVKYVQDVKIVKAMEQSLIVILSKVR